MRNRRTSKYLKRKDNLRDLKKAEGVIWGRTSVDVLSGREVKIDEEESW